MLFAFTPEACSVSPESVRRAFIHASGDELTLGLDRCMKTVSEPLLSEPRALDVDATVKTLYGTQEEARIGYYPMRAPAAVANLSRLPHRAAAEVAECRRTDRQPDRLPVRACGLWDWLAARPCKQWPAMLRGGNACGTEKTTCERL